MVVFSNFSDKGQVSSSLPVSFTLIIPLNSTCLIMLPLEKLMKPCFLVIYSPPNHFKLKVEWNLFNRPAVILNTYHISCFHRSDQSVKLYLPAFEYSRILWKNIPLKSITETTIAVSAGFALR